MSCRPIPITGRCRDAARGLRQDPRPIEALLRTSQTECLCHWNQSTHLKTPADVIASGRRLSGCWQRMLTGYAAASADRTTHGRQSSASNAGRVAQSLVLRGCSETAWPALSHSERRALSGFRGDSHSSPGPDQLRGSSLRPVRRPQTPSQDPSSTSLTPLRSTRFVRCGVSQSSAVE